MSVPNRSLPISPSPGVPWDVRVVTVVPKKVHDELEKKSDTDPSVIGAVTDGTEGCWSGILVNGQLYVWPTTSSLDHPPKNVHVLYHAKMAAPPAAMKISMTPTNASTTSTSSSSTSSSDVIFVHVASQDGHLYLWKISRRERGSPIARAPQARVALKLEHEEEVVTALSSLGTVLIVGTSHGALWWCTPTSHPIMLHAQRVERQHGGRLKRMIFGSTPAREEVIASIEILSPKVFLSISERGTVESFNVTVGSSHQATFQGTTVTTLTSVLFDALHTPIQTVQVLRTALHQRDLHFILLVNNERIYWVRGRVTQTSSMEVDHVQWLNRFHPDVKCVGLVATHGGNNNVYAAFQYDAATQQQQQGGGGGGGAPVTMMAFSSSGQVSEMDMPLEEVPFWIDGTLGRDVVTYGSCGISTTGLGIRIRCLATEEQPSSSRAAALGESRQPTYDAISSNVNTLAMHLRAAFWQWYPQGGGGGGGGAVRLPPSIQDAEPRDLEAAIVLTAKALQSHETGSKHNPIEWHNAFLKMLQQGGLYRSISQRGRWALLGIGQELAVCQALHGQLPVQADAVANALAQANDSQLLTLALVTAKQFRDENASYVYDVRNDQCPSHRLWTSNDTLQAVMWRQLETWSQATKLQPEQVAKVVDAALNSFKEASDPNQYEELKKLAIPLIRKIHNDHLAFEFAKEHSWNAGLCQIAHDNERHCRAQSEFKLDDLMQTRGDKFCEVVLKWHADQGLPADVLDYGRNCPDLLDDFLQNDDRLRRYRWIAAVRAKNFDLASNLLVENATKAASISEARHDFSMAKMCTRKNRESIDRKLELLRAQELLSGDPKERPLPPERLLSLALDKLELETQVSLEDKVQTAMIALAIAKASDDQMHFAAQVWSAAISMDREQWLEWLQTQDDMTDPQLLKRIRESTVFGGLLREIQGQNEEEVRYGGSTMDRLVLERLGMDSAYSEMEMRRLLHFVTTHTSEDE